ncbi:NAD(P)/FAD-dependent oxidoreductase [uncultured Piscinibacter sp.]|uniref:NAD(P)/FAD-dependent oxidoreductase n=1 Tax=uncultured Piscinibacter sp. TaxID=1131835 RepID=UPI00261F7D5A|nr:geranylgeranyl reductase family protein [uncultured Piscinibacter sp.]
MNLGIDQLPDRCDVLVVGAGPAGSAAAITLARAGIDVVLVDQHAFPRDKVCGDGLIPDAHRALRKLGVLDEVMVQARAATHAGLISPRGIRVDVPGTLAVLPRRQLDEIVCRAAVAAGARMHAPVRFVAPIEVNGVVAGARLVHGDSARELHCRWLVLASGAVPQALLAAGMALRQGPSGVALRGYLKNDAMRGRIDKLEAVWHRAVAPGYGWIFPCRDGVFNVGVGLVDSHARQREGRAVKTDVNLREVFDAFTRVYAPARELVQGGQWLSALKGAPLRTTLEGARFSRPGLLVTGEAAGSTYSFTGEGIGKAMETGMLAAEALIAGRAAGDASVRADYESRLAVLRPRFLLYERANWVNRHPWLADFILWRGTRSPRLRRRMSGVLDESSNPGHLLTVKGFARLLTE